MFFSTIHFQIQPVANAQTPAQKEDSVSVKVELDPIHRVTAFHLTANNATSICASNNCEFSIENPNFAHNTATGGYTFDGQLKSTVTNGDVKTSKFTNMHVGLVACACYYCMYTQTKI